MPPKMKLWTTESEFRLIYEVRSRPILWDVSLTDYRRNDLKEVEWEEVAKTLGPSFSSEIVKRRFSSMRDTFMDNQRKVRESKQRSSGKSPGELYVPKWPIFSSLTFLLRSVQQVESFSNITENTESLSTESTNIETSDTVEVYFDETLQEFVTIPTEPQEIMSPQFVSSPLSSPIEVDSQSNSPAVAVGSSQGASNWFSSQDAMFVKRGVKRGRTPLASPASDALRLIEKIATESVTLHEEDAADKFGAFVASKLRVMDETRRNICEAKTAKALYE